MALAPSAVHTAALKAGSDLDTLPVEIDDATGLAVKVLTAVFLFGIALDVKVEDFGSLLRRPRLFALGIAAQLVLLPGLALALIVWTDPQVSVAVGLLLLTCCPAGNLSNLLTHRARGDLAFSRSMTSASNALAIVVTPLAFGFWSAWQADLDRAVDTIQLSSADLLLGTALLIVAPFVAGVLVAWRRPGLARRLSRYVEPAVLVLLLVLIVGAVAASWSILAAALPSVGPFVLTLNAVALAVGYLVARVTRLGEAAARAMTFEVAIRNTGLGLVIALTVFPALGGVAVTVAMYGLWDVVMGLLLASWWRRRAPATPSTPGPIPLHSKEIP
ncbi:bile acid:sodium symporter family protein [Nocardioides sp.]|uniref:bile acid:sodium symporter family protein n=1 Tax=Nocardioides sp. TaxID=35761 RepID=UPI002735962B|nr:bile acid:sodium symporter family protein [Nocardioides sp.]MDP3889643.1 bile acid:sodium symporter family protein [Nocardioides sp.]